MSKPRVVEVSKEFFYNRIDLLENYNNCLVKVSDPYVSIPSCHWEFSLEVHSPCVVGWMVTHICEDTVRYYLIKEIL